MSQVLALAKIETEVKYTGGVERTPFKGGFKFETLPKAQRTRGLSSSCQSHITSSNANLDRISSSES